MTRDNTTAPRRFFGTDGVRDEANRGNMTPELAMRLAQSYTAELRKKTDSSGAPVLCIGEDPRRSSSMIASACAAGVMGAGGRVLSLGVIPSPGVSQVIRSRGLDGGIMISASHNSWEYNGIKLFSDKGKKLSDGEEARVEERMDLAHPFSERVYREDIGIRESVPFQETAYFRALVSRIGELPPLERPLVVDCAHGAASPLLARILEKEVPRKDILCIGREPRGTNINEKAGVMDMAPLLETVRRTGACLGMAFDGDADRVLLVDSLGRVINGDIMLWVLGRWFAAREGASSGVVATVMSNMALEEHLGKADIPVHRCPVGDRYVLGTMEREGSSLGGEQSGHLIAFPYFVSGDGPRGGFLFLQACAELQEEVDTLADRFGAYPQHLENLRIEHKEEVLASAVLRDKKEAYEKQLGGTGRIFIRPSGTEPLLRILVESRDMEPVPGIVEGLRACVLELEKQFSRASS